MISLTPSLKVFIYTGVADMRKGVNGLCGIVRSEFDDDPANGSLFVFVNRKRDRMKLLYFDGGGYWLYYRLLESGTFEAVKHDGPKLQIDATQLAMLLAGVSLASSDRRRKRLCA